MIPASIVELTEFPMLASGKIDRRSLPDPETQDRDEEKHISPRSENEKKMAAIWEDILEVEEVGINDDFFELGGHSLLAIRLVSAIRKAFEVEMPIGDIFDYPTIAQLLSQLTTQDEVDLLPPIDIAPRPELIPLSFGQNRLWFIDKFDGSLRYHIPSVLRLKGDLNIDALEKAIATIIQRHEVLRTVIRESDGEGYQYIKPFTNWKLKQTNISNKNEAGTKSLIQQLINVPFDLSKDDMIRVELLEFDKEDHILVVTIHHIASDGWSTSIMVNELVELYNSFDQNKETKLPALTAQYADFALWQSKYLHGEVLERKLNYWKNKLDGLASMDFPTDYPRPAIQSINGALSFYKIDKEIADKLNILCKEQGTTMFMTMLAALKVLLYRYSGQEDLCIGTPIAGRQHKEVEGLIGYFLNTLALRTTLDPDADFIKLLKDVKTTTLEAYQNQEAPFEKVVESVVKQRDPSRTPLFQVMFTLQNAPEVPELRLGNVKLQGQSYSFNASKFEMTIYIGETESGLNFAIDYCTDLFSSETISRLQEHFNTLLKSIVANPNQKLSLLTMLDSDSENLLLNEFNSALHLPSKQTTFVERFEQQVEKTPNATALVFENEVLTFGELNERSNKLAHFLVSKGVKDRNLGSYLC
jgi:NRPS condensation-like uncharacterized protein/acyl carrier protein